MEMEPVSSEISRGRDITHGICDACMEKCFPDDGEAMREFLDRIDAPVLMMQSEPMVRLANKRARDILGKDLPDIEGHTNGDVIDCVHAGEPGGCGARGAEFRGDRG